MIHDLHYLTGKQADADKVMLKSLAGSVKTAWLVPSTTTAFLAKSLSGYTSTKVSFETYTDARQRAIDILRDNGWDSLIPSVDYVVY